MWSFLRALIKSCAGAYDAQGDLFTGIGQRTGVGRVWCVRLASGTSGGGARFWVVGGCVFV